MPATRYFRRPTTSQASSPMTAITTNEFDGEPDHTDHEVQQGKCHQDGDDRPADQQHEVEGLQSRPVIAHGSQRYRRAHQRNWRPPAPWWAPSRW